jgi:hypothetical protein
MIIYCYQWRTRSLRNSRVCESRSICHTMLLTFAHDFSRVCYLLSFSVPLGFRVCVLFFFVRCSPSTQTGHTVARSIQTLVEMTHCSLYVCSILAQHKSKHRLTENSRCILTILTQASHNASFPEITATTKQFFQSLFLCSTFCSSSCHSSLRHRYCYCYYCCFLLLVPAHIVIDLWAVKFACNKEELNNNNCCIWWHLVCNELL